MSGRFLRHPRYGDQPIPSGSSVPEEEVRRGCFDWDAYAIEGWPETALPGDPARQDFCCRYREYHVDVAKRCGQCGREYIFFALEQRYWYEVLGFNVWARCDRCFQCRHASNKARRDRITYQALVNKPDPTLDEALQLAASAAVLWSVEILRDLEKLRRIRNMALRRIPGSPEAIRLTELVRQAAAAPRTV